MIEKKTVIDQIEITDSGHIGVRFGLLILEDGVEISRNWHRTMIEPGVDPVAVIDLINADITKRPELKAMPVDTAKVPLLKQVCDIVHTPDVVASHKAKIKKIRT